MSGIPADLVLAAFTGAAGFGSSWLTGRRSKRTEAKQDALSEGRLEIDERTADGQAYERAQVINKQIVDGLRTELTALQATIQSLRTDLASANETLRQRDEQLREELQRSAQLENHIRDLEASARTMRDLLERAGIDIPAQPEKEAR